MNADLVRELERLSGHIVSLASDAERRLFYEHPVYLLLDRQGILDAIRSEEDAVDRWMGRTAVTQVEFAERFNEAVKSQKPSWIYPTDAPREEE